MVIGIIGESCVGKSTLAQRLKEELGAEVITGRDYLRLAKSEAAAKNLFEKQLDEALTGKHLVYVISEREHLALLPDGSLRVLMTADLPLILERFGMRMRGQLPEPVKQMLEKKHGIFDREVCNFHIHNNTGMESVVEKIREAAF